MNTEPKMTRFFYNNDSLATVGDVTVFRGLDNIPVAEVKTQAKPSVGLLAIDGSSSVTAVLDNDLSPDPRP
ncbi:MULTISPECIES: hypothetical protein [Pseudomonas]|uniref:hypothetical protein n=1 Tax=Pseudomonas TaxID=286 RepID=UPI00224AEE77|nr:MULTISPECIES: hypothetical protein [unclassified Pseudomonas]MCX2888088.1 hypothetical protein [Pseudomonas sp. DCB_BI]MDH4551703.1 hypothetical protein [Pseudomonas sp. BN607]